MVEWGVGSGEWGVGRDCVILREDLGASARKPTEGSRMGVGARETFATQSFDVRSVLSPRHGVWSSMPTGDPFGYDDRCRMHAPLAPTTHGDKEQMVKEYYVYILSSKSKAIYTGVTNDLERRVREHKARLSKGHTAKYGINRLVWYESTNDMETAIEYEKRIKGWKREKKVRLIEASNPQWRDLSEEWIT